MKTASATTPRATATAGTQAFTLEGGYNIIDGKRIFNYNGREIISFLGREDLPGERVVRLPANVIEFAARQPLTSALLPCRIGYYPRAKGAKVTRPDGDWTFTLLFCLDGEGHLRLDHGQRQHTLSRGMIAILRPFEYHAYEADSRRPWSYYWVHFNGTLAQQYYDLLTSNGKHTCLTLRPDAHLVESIERILNIYHDGHAYKMLVRAAAALHQFFGDLYGQICGLGATQDSPRERVERSIELMRNNTGLTVRIQELASLANMTGPYFALHFRRLTGESPRSFFNKLKIRKACEHLETTNAKIENIARLVGCDDPYYFCRLFKRLTGKTPSRWRASASTLPATPPPRQKSKN